MSVGMHVARLTNPARTKAMKRDALDRLIRIELLWQQARSAGLAATDAEVDAAVAEARGRFRSEEAFLRRAEQSGFNEATYRAHTRKLLSGERYARRIVEREVQDTEQDIADFYASNPRSFRRDEQLRARHILVSMPPDAPAEVQARARSRIEELAARARAGESFEALARNHSDDATRQWGGELDPFSRGQKAQGFEDAAFALQVGEVSAAVQTPAGFHLIQLQQRLPAVTVAITEASERILEHLRETRGKDAVDREVEQLRGAGRVEVLAPL